MKIKFNFDENNYESIEIKFIKDSDSDVDAKTGCADMELMVINPVMSALRLKYPENNYELEKTEDTLKINCPSGDGKMVLGFVYRSLFTLIKFIEAGIADNKEGLSEEDRKKEAERIVDEIAKLSEVEIVEKLGIVKEDEEN